LFFLVDEQVVLDRFGNRYIIDEAKFQENFALTKGGAIFIGNSRLLAEEFSVAPSDYFVSIKNSKFLQNRQVLFLCEADIDEI